MTKRLLKAEGGAAPVARPSCPSSAHMGIDLHVHSRFSDGVKTPDELARMAQKAGLAVFALCDHDTAGGVAAMRDALRGTSIELIPGAELSTGQSGSTHVLCYGVAVLSPEMTAFLDEIAQERVGRAEEMLRLLAREGVAIPEEKRAALLTCSSVGRTHIARLLIELGAVHTVKQAFDRYLGRGRPAYVPRSLPSTADAVEAVRRMGAVPVLAHPMRTELEWPALCALILHLRERGLMGIEAYHPSASSAAARRLDRLARENGLLVTGGSDYHGDPSSSAHIGRLPAGWSTRQADVQALLHAANQPQA